MNRRIFYYSLLSLSIAACSGNDARRASGDFDYANNQEASELVIPEGLNKPKSKDDFEVVAGDKVFGPVGQQVDVRAPSLVLPVAASSRVENQNSDAIIWFDKVLEDQELKTFIIDSIKAQLAEDGVAIESEDELSLKSDWYYREKEEGMIFKDKVMTEGFKYNYTIAAKPHGRSVSVKVSLADYIKKGLLQTTDEVDPIDQQRAEMAMLNKITAQVDYRYRLKQRENHLMRATQKLVTIGENPLGEAAYVVEMEPDLLWQNLPIFFERHGFKVTDLNETKKHYFVDFEKPDVSLWDTIWGDDVPVVELENKKYLFTLTPQEQNSIVTIYDGDGAPIPRERLEAVFPVMEAGLSFREF